MNIYQFIQKKFPEDEVLTTLKVTWEGIIKAKDISQFLKDPLARLRETFTILPGARLVITNKHYFFCLGTTFKKIVYTIVLLGMLAVFCLFYLNSNFKTAFYAFAGFSFIFFSLAYFWIKRMERNYWPRENLKFVDRDKKIIGVFAPDLEKLGHAGCFVDIRFGILKFKIKEGFEEFESIIKEDFKKYNIGEKDITTFSKKNWLLIIIFTILFSLIFSYICFRYFLNDYH